MHMQGSSALYVVDQALLQLTPTESCPGILALCKRIPCLFRLCLGVLLVQASDRLYYLYQTIVDTQEALAGIPEGEQLMQRAQQALPLAFGANMNKSSDTAESGDGAGPSNGSGNGGKGTSKGAAGKAKQPGDWEGEAGDHGRELVREVVLALSDDLNTPVAVAALSAPLKLMNDLLHTKKVGHRAGCCGCLALCYFGLLFRFKSAAARKCMPLGCGNPK